MRGLDAARVTGILGGVLLIAYLLILTGRVKPEDRMASDAFGPTGTSAFAELLVRSGYRVRVEREPRPRFAKDEAVVVFSEHQESAEDALEPVVRRGGKVLLLLKAKDGGGQIDETFVNRSNREQVKVRIENGNHASLKDLEGGTRLTMYTEKGGRAGVTYLRGLGGPDRETILLQHGEIGLNGFIDKAQNAALVMGLVRSIAPGKRVTLWEGAGVSQGGLLSALGAWSFAARNQLVVALIAAGVLLGARFGLAPTARGRQVGQREQADALGELLRRWRGPAVGIEAAIEQARRRLVASRKLPASAPREQWVKYLRPETIDALGDAELWAQRAAKPGEALRAIARLQAAVDAEGVR